MANLLRAATIEDLRRMARRRTPRFVFDALEQGAGSGETIARNVADFRKCLFVPRALVDVTPVDMSRTLFGRRYAFPFGISAVGLTGIYRRGADEMLAEAAREADIPFILSGLSTGSIDRIMRIAPHHTWGQLYFAKDSTLTDRIVGRVRDAGVEALVLTVDYPVPHRSEPVLRSGVSLMSGPPLQRLPSIIWDTLTHPLWTLDYLRYGGAPRQESWAPFAPAGSNAKEIAKFVYQNWPGNPVWGDVERVRRLWPGKLVLKGLVHPADALTAAELGVDAVTVSNHGGNKLDCMRSAIDTLRSVKGAVGDRMSVFFDGGIRRGSDIVAASAIGAEFCFLGRATLYGAVAKGRHGAKRAIEILSHEAENTMAMIGCPTFADIGPQFLHSNVA